MTIKQRYANIRKRQLISFRRFVSLGGNGDAVRDYIGMNAFELRNQIQNKWLSGMSWDNYGEYWVIDHIVALKYFDPTDIKQMKLCWHIDNLNPFYYWDNHAKGYCIEVTKGILDGSPKSAMIELLVNKISVHSEMFEPYYSKK